MNGALPSFDLGQTGLLLALVRGLSVASLLSLFGTMAFWCVVAPPALAQQTGTERAALARRLRRWALWSALAATVMLLIWAPFEAAAIAGADSLNGAVSALPDVMGGTRFGHLILMQSACVLATAIVLWLAWRPRLAVLPAGLAVVLHAGHAHALAMQPGVSLLLVSDALHLLAAGAWLGGLVPLLLMVRHAPPRVGAGMCRFYSPLGKGCLVVILATACIQFWQLIGGVPGLVGTAYGWMAVCKIVLFGVLFGFAVVNRYRLAPALLKGDPEPRRAALVRSIGVQTGAALAVVLVAGILSQLSPAIHAEPVWPFAAQFSLVTVREDPEFLNEVLRALAMIGGAVALMAAGIIWRRRWFGWLSIGIAGTMAALAMPSLDLLFIPATPTSFYQSPSGFSAQSIAAGATLYPRHCAGCHGAEGRGDGALAAGSAVPPADLSAPHLWEHADGEMFWWLAHGIEGPEGGLVMPGFSGKLGDDDLWALIDFVRARNGGLVHAATGTWLPPLAAPGFQMVCAGGITRDLRDLRGSIVRLVFHHATTVKREVTVLQQIDSKDVACTADDPAIPAAYAVVAGVSEASLDDAELLIDGAGWLRRLHTGEGADDETGWAGAAADLITRQPIAESGPSAGHHHH